MRLEPIHKTPRDPGVPPPLRDYARDAASFSWEAARRELDGLPGGRGLNIAHEAVDRHAAGARGARDALLFPGARMLRDALLDLPHALKGLVPASLELVGDSRFSGSAASYWRWAR